MCEKLKEELEASTWFIYPSEPPKWVDDYKIPAYAVMTYSSEPVIQNENGRPILLTWEQANQIVAKHNSELAWLKMFIPQQDKQHES